MADVYTAKSESLVAVADAIRTKTGKSAKMSFPEGFVSEISEIETGGGGTAEENDINFFDYDGIGLIYLYAKILYLYRQKKARVFCDLHSRLNPRCFLERWLY